MSSLLFELTLLIREPQSLTLVCVFFSERVLAFMMSLGKGNFAQLGNRLDGGGQRQMTKGSGQRDNFSLGSGRGGRNGSGGDGRSHVDLLDPHATQKSVKLLDSRRDSGLKGPF